MIDLKVFGKPGSGVQNWIFLLQQAFKIFSQLPESKDPTNAVPGGSGNSSLESSAVKLFRSAVLKQHEACGAAIFANFELAALHLHQILTNVSVFEF